MDVTTLKMTPAGKFRFVKPIQETNLAPKYKDGKLVGYEEKAVGDPVTEIPCGDKMVKVGDEFEPSLFWTGRFCKFIDDGNVELVGKSEKATRLQAIEDLKTAIHAEDFDALKAPLDLLGFKRPKKKEEALKFAETVVMLAKEDF